MRPIYKIRFLSDWATFISGAVGITTAISALAIGKSFDLSALIGLSSAVGANGLGTWLDNRLKRAEDKEAFARFEDLLRHGREDRVVITAKEAMSQIAASIPSAEKVINTNVNVRDRRLSNVDLAKAIQASYESFLTSPIYNQWYEIVGISELFSPRYQSVVTKQCNGEFRVTVLRNSSPILDFFCMESAQGKEIYFGWMSDWNEDSQIIFSKSSKLATVFLSYTNRLVERHSWLESSRREFRVEPGEPISKQLGLLEIHGRWLTSEYERGNIATYGVIDIAHAADGVQISAHIFDTELRHLSSSVHSRSKISHSPNRLYFEYSERNRRDHEISGIGCYEMHPDGDNLVLTGFTTRYRDDLKRELKGIRVGAGRPDDISGSRPPPQAEMRRLVDANLTFL